MQLIEFDKLIYELSDTSFCELKERVDDYLSFYFIDDSELVTKDMFLEKLGDYLKQFEVNNFRVTDKKFSEIYYDELASLIKDRTAPSGKANEFYSKFQKLLNAREACENNTFYSNLEDFTKIFLTIYSKFIENREKVQKIDFLVSEIDYDKLTESFLEDKPEINKDVKRLLNKAEQMTPKAVKRAMNEAQDVFGNLQNKVSKLAIRAENKKKKDFERIYSVLQEEKDGHYFTKRIFAYILMTIVYLRLKDFEEGL